MRGKSKDDPFSQPPQSAVAAECDRWIHTMGSALIFLTPFEMAARLHEEGIAVPSYPKPIALDRSRLGAGHERILDAAFIHQCDAWEWQVQCIYARTLGADHAGDL